MKLLWLTGLDLKYIDIKIVFMKNRCIKKVRGTKRFKMALALVGLGLLVFLVSCKDAKVSGEYSNPYTPQQVKKMMAYHGALVAKFDGKQWWFLSGNRWIKLENYGALDFALATTQNKKNQPVL